MNVNVPYHLFWADTPDRQACCRRFMQQAYQREFNAVIPHYLPYQLGMTANDGSLVAACGVMPASEGRLYLENYLEAPVEQLASRQGLALERHQLAEIGNFAAADGASARIMFVAICLVMNHNRFKHIAFTGTRKLRNIFARLNLDTVPLADAYPDALGSEAENWGSYYTQQPRIMLGDLAHGYDRLSKNSLLLSLFASIPSFPFRFKELKHDAIYRY